MTGPTGERQPDVLTPAAPDPMPESTLQDAENTPPNTAREPLLARVAQGVELARHGRFKETVDILDDTRRRLSGHPLAELAPVLPGVLTDLGLAQTLCGRFSQAKEHLHEARALADARRLPLLGLVARQNLGCLDLYQGDSASAISTFHELAHLLPTERQEALRVDLAEALLSEGLVEEAGRTLAEAPWQEALYGTARTLVEAKLRLLNGDRRGALYLSRRIRGHSAPGSLWYRLADRLVRVSHWASSGRTPTQRARATLDLRAPSATACQRTGTPHKALNCLAQRDAPQPGPWLADAAHDPQVVRAGLEKALLAGDPATALEWAELGRTWADGLVPGPGTYRDTAVEDLTGHYRGALHDGPGPTASAYARRWESAHWRALRSGPRSRPHRYPGPVLEPLLCALAGRAFVHYTAAGTEAVALVAVDGRVQARPLGSLLRVRRVLARFTHEQSASTGGAGSEATRNAADAACTALVRPILPLVGDRPLVVTGEPYLGDPPWGLLPSLRGRPVHLVPTARFWVERPPAERDWKRVLLASGPGPTEARAEVATLAGLYPDARLLERARREQVLDGLASTDLAHLAGHGHVGDQTAMLSQLELHDGPLLACDLARLESAPALVTLSSCWGGHGYGGTVGRPRGFVGALLALGTGTVVASPVPVGDAETGTAMRAFHRALTAGADVSEAVSDHLGHIGFCCYGA
ncbi:CHAT domain-containing protein [Nocardiopsis nanhaiensis]